MSVEHLQLEQYKIIRKLGTGGMAEVFLADKIGAAGFSKRVAIKTILAGNAPKESLSLFLDEARVASFLQHSGIVQTLDLGIENDTLFIAMEYVAGPTLSRLVYDLKKMGGLLPWPAVAYIGAKVAHALDYAHRRATDSEGQSLNLIHRDISPQNILITRDAIVKLTDFGVARASIQMHTTKTGQVRGKAAYMAPEQVRAKQLDGRTDMFALGVVLYEAFTGFRPFQRKTDIQSMRAVLGDTPPPIAKRNPSVPQELLAIINRCLEKKADDRFSNCGELEAALQESFSTILVSDITDKISEIMTSVFGAQSFEDIADHEPIEAWQPTIQVDAQGQIMRPELRRFEDSSIAQDIAELIGETSDPAASPELALARAHSDVALKVDALFANTANPLLPAETSATNLMSSTVMPKSAQPSIARRSLVLLALSIGLLALALQHFREPLSLFDEQAIESTDASQNRRRINAVQGKSLTKRPVKPKASRKKVKTSIEKSPHRSTIKKAPRIRKQRVKVVTKDKPKLHPPPGPKIGLSLVLDLAERAEISKKTRLKEDLETIVLKLTENRTLSTEDRALIRQAQDTLR